MGQGGAATAGEQVGARGEKRGPVVLVISPHAGRAEAAAAENALLAAGVQIGERIVVSELDRERAQGAVWRERGWRIAVAAGGDGTIGAVASHLAGSGLTLGILPMGTSNDTARSLGIPLDPQAAADVIASGQAVSMDAGQALPALTAPLALAADAPPGGAIPTATPDGSNRPVPESGAYFLHALTLGFNAEFARLATDVARRQRFGPLTYAASMVEALATYKAVHVTLHFTDVVLPGGGAKHQETIACDALQIAAVNTPVFGGALNMRLPNVNLRDALLDFVVIEALDPSLLRRSVEGLIAALSRLPETVRGRIISEDARRNQERIDEMLDLALPGIRRYKARAALIESDRVLDVTLDGEVRTRTPVSVRVAPEPIRVMLPPGAWAELE